VYLQVVKKAKKSEREYWRLALANGQEDHLLPDQLIFVVVATALLINLRLRGSPDASLGSPALFCNRYRFFTPAGP